MHLPAPSVKGNNFFLYFLHVRLCLDYGFLEGYMKDKDKDKVKE